MPDPNHDPRIALIFPDSFLDGHVSMVSPDGTWHTYMVEASRIRVMPEDVGPAMARGWVNEGMDDFLRGSPPDESSPDTGNMFPQPESGEPAVSIGAA